MVGARAKSTHNVCARLRVRVRVRLRVRFWDVGLNPKP